MTTTAYQFRATIIAPDAMRDDANQLAMILGSGPADEKTFGEPRYEDAAGNLYAVASTVATVNFEPIATSTLERPAWDGEPYVVNMTGAERAQAALYIHGQHGTNGASTDRVWVLLEPAPGNAQAAISLAGVSRVEDEGLDSYTNG
jgi:hypothetical protein